MRRNDTFKLFDAFGNRIYTAHDLVRSGKDRRVVPFSYNSIRVLANKFNRGFKKDGATYYTQEDVDFMNNKEHNAGRPKIIVSKKMQLNKNKTGGTRNLFNIKKIE